MALLEQKLDISNKKTIVWTKMSGAGNSFWITHFLSTDSGPPTDAHWPGLARKLCRQMAKPADGIAILLPSKECDFKWLFYNADGSMAEMCGNLACCVTEYAFKKKLVPANRTSLIFETKAGKIKGAINPTQVFRQQSKEIKGPFTFAFQNQEITYRFINSGVPHAVIQLRSKVLEAGSAHLGSQTKPKPDSHLLTWPASQQEWEDKKALAKALRKNTCHHKNGMNVSFYTKLSPQESYVLFPKQEHFPEKQKNHTLTLPAVSLLACSFERGVEDWTPACGTGALAVAQLNQTGFVQSSAGEVLSSYKADMKQANANKTSINPTVLVQMPGGVLQVKYHLNKTLSLTSPVQWLEEKRL